MIWILASIFGAKRTAYIRSRIDSGMHILCGVLQATVSVSIMACICSANRTAYIRSFMDAGTPSSCKRSCIYSWWYRLWHAYLVKVALLVVIRVLEHNTHVALLAFMHERSHFIWIKLNWIELNLSWHAYAMQQNVNTYVRTHAHMHMCSHAHTCAYAWAHIHM